MAEITKQALKVDNNQSFPNNNNGAITPSILRAFNTNMIDSMVDEIGYTADSSSWNSSISQLNASSASQQVSINALNVFTSSQQSFNASATASIVELLNLSSSLSGGFVTEGELAAATASLITQINTKLNTSSFNSYTSSTDSRLTNIETTTASLNSSVTQLNANTASQQSQIDSLIAFTGSNTNTSLNQYTQSNDTKWSNLGGQSGSWITESETASFARTNVDNNFTANQTFTNITATSASITYLTTLYETSSVIYSSGSNQFGDELSDIQTLSGSVKVQGSLTVNGTPVLTSSVDISGLTTTASFNAYTQSNNQRVSSLEVNSASVNTSITNINTTTASLLIETQNLELFSASALTSLSNLNTATASLFTSTSLSLTTASFSGNTLTFTKGDNSTFGVVIPDVSGSTINTGSLMVTGSVAGNILTFTKGDATTFSLTVATGSGGGSTIDTGSFATTGSNSFNGSQTITGSITTTQDITISGVKFGFGNPAGTSSIAIGFNALANNTGTNNVAIGVSAAQLNTNGEANTIIGNNAAVGISSGSANTIIGYAAGAEVRGGSGNTFIGQTAGYKISGSANTFIGGYQGIGNENGVIALSDGNQNVRAIYNNGWVFTGSVDIQNTLTASLQEGYVWVGNSAGRTVTVATSSFGSGGTINTGSFATTGSNTFTGQQQIQSNNLQFNTTGSISTNGVKWNNSEIFQNNFLNFVTRGNVGVDFSTDGAATEPGVNINFTNNNAQGAVQFTTTNGDIRLRSGGTNTLLLSGSAITFNGVDFIPFSASIDSRINGIVTGTGFATTGSNTFTGNQTISSSAGGGDYIINASGTNGIVTYGQTGLGNFQIQQSGSTIMRGTSPSGFEIFASASFVSAPSIPNITSDLKVNGNFTASLQQGYVWVGNSSGTTVTVATSSFGGGGGGQTFNNPSVESISGSLLLTANTFNSGSGNLTHLSASAQNQANLVFKNNNNSGTTIISGSNNIFTNPSNPNTGYIKYVGGSNNLYLNSSSGIATQITASATSVSGNRPSMNNNIFTLAGDFIINQGVNPGTHTYTGNIFGGASSTTINATAFTGSLTISNNINYGALTITAASASNNEITGGFSGSHTIQVSNNNNNGSISITTNRNQGSNISNNYTGNILNGGGSLTINNQSSSVAVNATNNIATATMSYTNVGALGLGLHRTTATISANYGALSLIASASAISAQNNISPAAMSVTNRMYSGSFGSGSLTYNNNQTQGASNTYTVSGSYNGTSTGPVMVANGIFGASNTFFTNVEGRGNYVSILSNIFGGANLIMTGSQNNVTPEAAGGAHFGRYNANDGIRNTTGENIFSVGTGNSTTRKTGFLIDSGSNTFVEGTFNVSGSTSLTGSLTTFGDVTLTTGKLELTGVTTYMKANNLTGSWGQTNDINGNALRLNGSLSIAPTFEAKFATGSNQQAGTAVLDGANPGTVTVSNSLVTANSIIMVSKQTLAHPNGYVAVSAKSAGSFTITSNHNGDTDTVGWFIINNS